MDTAQVNGVVTLSNGVETDSNGLSNGSDLEERSHKWVNDVTRKGINKEEILHGYKQWTSHSDYETVKSESNVRFY